LHLFLFHPTTRAVEDWEAFFAEKSRRRADKERQRKRSARLQVLLIVAIVVIALGAVTWLAVK